MVFHLPFIIPADVYINTDGVLTTACYYII